jgi:transposase
LNTKLHAVCDGNGKPVMMALLQGQMSDHTGAKLLYPHLPPPKYLIADKGYESDEFYEALKAKKIKPCVPPRSDRNIQHKFSKTLYKQRHKVECMFGKLKD